MRRRSGSEFIVSSCAASGAMTHYWVAYRVSRGAYSRTDSKSDSELPRHFWPFLKARLGYERASAISHFACALGLLLCRCFASRRTQRPRLYSQIENEADAGLTGITCYMVRPNAL